MKNLKFLLLALMLSIGIGAQSRCLEDKTYYYQGFHWKFYIFDGKAEISGFTESKNSYVGTLEIPNVVRYNGVEYPVVGISSYAFNDMKAILNIIFPPNLERIGQCAFSGCMFLKQVVIRNNIKEIESSAFRDCTSLETVTIYNPAVLSETANFVFSNCTKLRSVTLPEGTTYIPSGFFTVARV